VAQMNFSLLGYDVTSLDGQFPTRRRKVLFSSSRIRTSKNNANKGSREEKHSCNGGVFQTS